jgi:hypothetical protein
MRKYFGTLTAMVAVATVMASASNAATSIDKKVGQFGLEARVEGCGKWASGKWPWGGRWKVCIGPNMQFLQHDFHLVVNGPDADESIRKVLDEALGVAVSAAIGTGLLTPSPEPAARIGAALAAAKMAFLGYLASRGLQQLLDQYDIRLEHRTFWS